jgi:hypothetical protein
MIHWARRSYRRASVILCRTADELRAVSLQTPTGEGVVILRIGEGLELEDLQKLRQILLRLRIVIVYGGTCEMDLENTHNFFPRFVGHEDFDNFSLQEVITRMIKMPGDTVEGC